MVISLCLGNPSFSILKVMLRGLFKGFDLDRFHYDSYELAKHKHVSFPIRNTIQELQCLLLLFIVMFKDPLQFIIFMGLIGLSHLLTIVLEYHKFFSPKTKIRC